MRSLLIYGLRVLASEPEKQAGQNCQRGSPSPDLRPGMHTDSLPLGFSNDSIAIPVSLLECRNQILPCKKHVTCMPDCYPAFRQFLNKRNLDLIIRRTKNLRQVSVFSRW